MSLLSEGLTLRAPGFSVGLVMYTYPVIRSAFAIKSQDLAMTPHDIVSFCFPFENYNHFRDYRRQVHEALDATNLPSDLPF